MPENFCKQTRKPIGAIVFAIAIAALPGQISAAVTRPVTINTTITNAVTRYLTNVIEVSMPKNVFVDEFRTNWVRRDVINLVDLFKTNVVLQYRTNVLTVDRRATNFVTAWRTNVKAFALTNWENVVVNRTNVVTADRYLTNLVTAWHTNLKSLTLTNWQNLVLLRTNWVVEHVTNFVELTRTNFATLTVTNWKTATVINTNFVSSVVSSPGETAQPIAVAASVPSPALVVAPTVQALPTASAADLARGLEFNLSHAGAPKQPGEFPIRLTLQSASGATLPVSEWRVEKTDGGGLMVGSKPEFSAALPSGTYRITARVRVDNGTTKSIRGNMEIKSDNRAVRASAEIASNR